MCRYDPDAAVAATWVHKIQSYVPTLNSIGINSKNNHNYRKWRRIWEGEFGPWLQTIPPALKYRRVVITRWYGTGKRPFDSGNFAGGTKPLVDTLTNFGALYDDSNTWCECHHVQIKSPDGKDYVEVQIQELA